MGIVGLITKDVKEKNENKRVIVSLRILYIIVAFVFILNTLLAGTDAVKMYPLRFLFLFSALILLLVLTYRSKTKTALQQFILFLFVWTVSMIPVYGWSAGMQNYYIIILMLCFFASHSRTSIKFVYAGFVLFFRIMTIWIFGGIKSQVVTDPLFDKSIQISNITAVFTGIIFISYIFSKQENEAEGKLMKYNDHLQKQANTDQLTGLYNRRRAADYLKEITSQKNYQPVSVAIGDIDFFKKVNDTYGHDVGDEVLKFVAHKMNDTCREDTFLSRWGGEEFLLVFPDCNGDNAYIALERLRNAIQNSEIQAGDNKIKITMTFGLAEFSYNRDEEATVKEADEKLYMGKQNGRNQVVF